MISIGILICFIIILIIISIIGQYINYYYSLTKPVWTDSPILYTILLALSLMFLTIGIFVNFKDNIATIPLFFLIFFFEIIWLLSFLNRMYSTSVALSIIIFILTGFEIILLFNGKSRELCWLISPFFFFSLIQIAITDNISKYNISHEDLIN